MSQSSKWVHFGLGNEMTIRELVVHWPGSGSQTFAQLEADRRYLIQEGDQPRPWSSPRHGDGVGVDPVAEDLAIEDLPLQTAAENAEQSKLTLGARIVLTEPIPTPQLVAASFDGQPLPLNRSQDAVLVNLWATWCIPCLAELTEFARRRDELQRAGLAVVALSVDGLRGDERSAGADAKKMVEGLSLPFETGMATPELLDKLDVFQDTVLKMTTKIDEASTFPIPSSLLIDRYGRVVCIYQGVVSIEQLLADRRSLDQHQTVGRPLLPFSGRWFLQPRDSASVLARFADRFLRRGYADEAQRYAGLAADLVGRASGISETRKRIAGVYNDLGNFFDRQGQLDEAEHHFREALRSNPQASKARTNLGNVYRQRGQNAEARRQYLAALQIDPNQLQAHINLGSIYFAEQKLRDAVTHYRRGLQIEPEYPLIHNLLGLALAHQGNHQAAAEHFSQALRLDPNYQEAHQNLATLRAAMERGP